VGRYSCDAGWGCAIRAGQMMLGQILQQLHLGRHWRAGRESPLDHIEPQILELFKDSPEAPFSLHRIVEVGSALGKGPGVWFGSASIAHVLSLLVQQHAVKLEAGVSPQDSTRITMPAVLVVTDGCIYRERVHALVDAGGKAWGRPVALLLALRLGVYELEAVYARLLQACLECKWSLGIVGGHPNSAHYFVGCTREVMLYLDPHRTQPSQHSQPRVDPSTFHCTSPPCVMRITDMDPSLTVGFLCTSQADFDTFCEWVEALPSKTSTTVFTVEDVVPSWASDNCDDAEEMEDDGFALI